MQIVLCTVVFLGSAKLLIFSVAAVDTSGGSASHRVLCPLQNFAGMSFKLDGFSAKVEGLQVFTSHLRLGKNMRKNNPQDQSDGHHMHHSHPRRSSCSGEESWRIRQFPVQRAAQIGLQAAARRSCSCRSTGLLLHLLFLLFFLTASFTIGCLMHTNNPPAALPSLRRPCLHSIHVLLPKQGII